jgi:hypothetical protein
MQPVTRRFVRFSSIFVAAVCMFSALGANVAFAGSSGNSNDSRFTRQFENPGAESRPKIRWWLPSTELSDDEIRREAKAIAEAGIGGVEVEAYPIEGGDAATHGWGTPEWNKRMKTVLETAKKYGLTVDMTVGPQYPGAVPSIAKESTAAAKELLYGKTTVAGGSTFSGAVPSLIEVPLEGLFGAPARQPGTPSLVAVTAAKVAAGSSASDTPVKLEPGSLKNITASAVNGQLNWTAPAGGEWIIFSFWQRSTGQAVGGAAAPAYAVDHFSTAGTKATTDYWEDVLLTSEVRSLLKHTGGDLFEDSLELLSALHWTPNMLNEFKTSSGYDITPYLPVLFIPGLHDFMGILSGATVNSTSTFTFADGSDSRVRNDYYQTLTQLYERNHLDGLRKWSNKQGLQFRAQPAYGATLDMASASTHVDVPEIEQFYFRDSIDSYRLMAGAAHMADKQIYSTEIAPMTTGLLLDAYGSSWKRVLEISNQNFAGGVNQLVWHGFPYADAPGAAWPGWHPFASSFLPGFAEAWGPRQPTWKHMPDINGYASRQQVVLQNGKPKVDIAIYRQSYWESPVATTLYNDSGLERAGYSYDFVNDSLFNEKSARVGGRRLNPDGPAYRAVVLDNQKIMSLDAARKILAYAKQGLPVMVVGDTPSATPFFHSAAQQDAALQQTIQELLAQPSVKHIATKAELPGVLAGKNIRPAARYHAQSGLLNAHRTNNDSDFYYFFNNSTQTVDHEVSLEGKGQAYTMDAWTGDITPLSSRGVGGTRTVRVRLQPHDTMLVALTTNNHFANAKQQNGTPKQSQQLSSWHLTVEDWRPGASATETTKLTQELGLTSLKPWTEVPQLEDVSGIGRYTTAINWGGKPGTDVLLDLGAFFDTARVYVNGRALPPVNLNNPRISIGEYLKKGQNTIAIEIATTLRNRMRTINAGQAAVPRQEYGLIGPVRLHWSP